jgi:integration host factor subunit beta
MKGKQELTKAIAGDLDLPILTVQEAVQQVFDGIIATLVAEGRIELRNFDVLQVKERKARRGRNPRTGEVVDVPRRLVITFKAGKEMEQRVRQLEEVPGMVGAAG